MKIVHGKYAITLSVVFFLAQTVRAQRVETVIQKGHELAVLALALSHDSAFVITGSKDKSAKLWERATGREIRSFLGHTASVSSVAVSPDGKTLLTGSYDKSFRLWDMSTGKEMFSGEFDDYVTDVDISRDMKFFTVSGYADSVWIVDFSTRKILKKIPANPDKGNGGGVSVDISRDGNFIAVGEDNRITKLYRRSDWSMVREFTFESGWCGGCYTIPLFSDNGQFLYMGSHNGPLKRYNLNSGTLDKKYEDESDDLADISLSPDGKWLTRTTEKGIAVFDTESGKQLHQEVIDKGALHAVRFTSASEVLIASDDNVAFSWQIKDGKRRYVLSGMLNERDQGGLNYDPNFYWQQSIARYIRFKNSILISRDGKSLIKGKFGKKLRRWDVATGKNIMEYAAHDIAPLCYQLSRDGKRLISGGGDGKILLWDLESGKVLRSVQAFREPVFDLQFNNDESKVIASSWDATVRIYDLSTSKMDSYHDLKNNSAYCLRFLPGDLYYITGKLDNSIELWEIDTKTVVRTFTGHTGIISGLLTTADGKTLISASWDGSVRVWNIGTGLMERKLTTGATPVYAIMLSPDERILYTAGADRIIRAWEISTGKSIRSFNGHLAEITSLVLSPDNKLLISHSVDGVTKFWDLQSGNEFYEHIHLGEKDWMVKNPEGYFNGTDQARKYIHFVDGLKTFSVDQFFNDFYRPELLPKIFQNRGSKETSQNIRQKITSSPPPIVRIAVVPKEDGMGEVVVRLEDSGAGVREVKVFHNGKSVQLPATVEFPKGKGTKTTFSMDVQLIGGNNTFTAIAQNNDLVESDARSAELFSEKPTRSSTCHIMAVGINQYENPKLSLNYARPDAESFAKVIGEKGKQLFQSVKLHAIYDGEATRANILDKLDMLAQTVSQEDVFILYYAGHGSMVDNQFYFVPTESSRLYDASSLNKEAIRANIIQEKLQKIKALKQLIIMDACQSGGSVELLAARGASEEKAIAQLSRSAGIHVMASAGSEQFAAEFNELGHGLFTYVLLKGLQGEADGAPKDGKVTIYELKSYIDDQMPEMTRQLKGKPQYPFTFSRGHDFPVCID